MFLPHLARHTTTLPSGTVHGLQTPPVHPACSCMALWIPQRHNLLFFPLLWGSFTKLVIFWCEVPHQTTSQLLTASFYRLTGKLESPMETEVPLCPFSTWYATALQSTWVVTYCTGVPSKRSFKTFPNVARKLKNKHPCSRCLEKLSGVSIAGITMLQTEKERRGALRVDYHSLSVFDQPAHFWQ